MPRNTIYYAEFTERQWNWRVEIIPADSTTLPATRIYEEIDSKGFEGIEKPTSKMGDKLPIGIMAAPTMTLKFDLAWLPKDLVTYLTNPVQVDAGTVSHGTYSRTYDLANVVVVYNNRGSGSTMYPYFIGCQKPSVKRKYKISKYGLKFEIDLVHLGKVAAENVLLKDVQQTMLKKADLGTITTYTTSELYDYISYSAGSGSGIIVYESGDMPVGTDIEATMFELSSLFYEILEETKEAIRQFMRLPITDIYYGRNGSPFDAIKYYEQSFDGSNSFGSVASGSEGENLFFAGLVHYSGDDPYDYADQFDGYLMEVGEASMFKLGSSSKNPTAWDWFKLVCEENYVKLKVRTAYSGSYPIVKYDFDTLKGSVSLGTLGFTDIHGDPEIEAGETVISEVIGNYIGLSGNETDEYSYHIQGSFAEDDYEFKCTMHTLPRLDTATYETILPSSGLWEVKTHQGFETNKLYYRGSLPWLSATNGFIRCHEYVLVYDGVTHWTGETPHDWSTFYVLGTVLSTAINVQFISMQDATNKALTIAKALGESFSKYGQATVKLKGAIGMVPMGYVGGIYELDKDLSHYRWQPTLPTGLLGELSTTAHVMEVKDDVHKGQTDVTLFVEGS